MRISLKLIFLKQSFNLPDLPLFHLTRADPKAVSCVVMDLQLKIKPFKYKRFKERRCSYKTLSRATLNIINYTITCILRSDRNVVNRTHRQVLSAIWQ